MARSYTRPKRGRKNTLLVTEKPVTPAVSTNSLYCLPAKATFAAGSNYTILRKAGNHSMQMGANTGDPTVDNVVRCSSLLMSSKSPFQIEVRNASGGYTLYECPAIKVVRLTLSRETSVAGNPALFLAQSTGSPELVKLLSNEDAVDIRYNFVVDSTFDE